jgi:nucleotidyltransferase/DNA polymerase involved in DNA repair
MMGERRVMQEALFYGFSLERHVRDDRLLRKIDRFVDLSEVRAHLGPMTAASDGPSIDPELICVDGDVPDHSTFSKNRHGRFRESDLLRKLFETVVARCMKEGIVGGDALAVAASIMTSDCAPSIQDTRRWSGQRYTGRSS